MAAGLELPDDYPHILARVKEEVRASQLAATRVVNTELIKLYWSIGDLILDQQRRRGWGAKVIDKLARDLRAEFPDMKGFSPRNLAYMRAMAAAWPGTIVQQAVARLPWGHVVALLNKLDTQDDRDWYAAEAVRNGWSRNVLLHQIAARLRDRVGSAPSNFAQALPPPDSDLAQQITKDPYVFDFLGLTGDVAERQLEDAMMERLQRVLLEMGAGFAFVARQHHIEVAGDDFYIDLLLFHVEQLRYVVVELKIGRFEPAHLGQLAAYVGMVDARLRRPDRHQATLGLLLCSDSNDLVVRYTLAGTAAPVAVATYTWDYDSLPEEVRQSVPSPQQVAEAAQTPVTVGGEQLSLLDYIAEVGARLRSDEKGESTTRPGP